MKQLLIAGCWAVTVVGAASAAVTLPNVFGDNMVLQQNAKIPVWGKAAPNEKVTVSFAGQTVATTAGAEGKWRVDLAPLAATSVTAEFRVTGENEIVLKNVVVGEVWFCSGQSNMEFTMSSRRKVKDWEKEVAAANWPLIRHFNVDHKISEVPLDDVPAKWVDTTPATIPPQSAVAFFFGETLHKELKVPVGLINCSWGGTRIEPWTPAGHVDDLWLLQHQVAWGRPQDVPTVLWNGMVAGLVPYAIKGAIWYQGCANRLDGAAYLDKTVSLVRGWRREWQQGDFPYFLVQLAPYRYDGEKGLVLALLQEAQARVPATIPNTGYTVINDVGDVKDIHPTDKRTVGMRMADQALDRVYGKFVRPWRTQTFQSAKVEGNAMRLSFTDAEGLKTRDGQAPTEFELRGVDGMWVKADARIEGTEVVLSSSQIEQPTAMRFAPYNGSTPNLVNGAGLPAGPFRFGMPTPLGAAEKLAELKGMTCVQRYDIPVCTDFRRQVPKTLSSIQNVQQVAYLLELQNKGGETEFVLASMDTFAPTSDELVLSARPNRQTRTAVKNLTVRTNSRRVQPRTSVASGFVEFYTCNYSASCQKDPKGGSKDKHDFNDTPILGKELGYGCLQIHDVAKKETILAFNNINKDKVPADVGIGTNPDHKGNPDWTFARNAGDYAARRISVWVK